MSFLCSVCLQSSFLVKQSLGFCFKSDFLYWVHSKWHKKFMIWTHWKRPFFTFRFRRLLWWILQCELDWWIILLFPNMEKLRNICLSKINCGKLVVFLNEIVYVHIAPFDIGFLVILLCVPMKNRTKSKSSGLILLDE